MTGPAGHASYDAAIVGGGPAGCSAAITLAMSGVRVVLFEAKTYPHHKVCGEFLSPECIHALDALGVTPALRAAGPVLIETVRITAPDGTAWRGRFPGAALGISRSLFDATLAGHACALGVEVREATTVTTVRGDLRDGFELELRTATGRAQVQARTVIAAHGKRGILDRALKRRFLDQPQPFVALKNHFHGPPLPNHIDLHTFPGGYCGMSEIEGGAANVCLLAHQSVFQDGPNGPAEVGAFLEWMQRQNPRLGEWLCQAEPVHERWLSIGQVPFIRKRAVVDDILMAGDAAGLIVPLAGDGIAMALVGGRLAAAHTAAFLGGKLTAERLRRQYARDWQREFGGRLALARFLQVVMLRPRLLSLGLRLINAVPPLGEFLVARTRGG
jgi:menaquinone-9 beta-reductase